MVSLLSQRKIQTTHGPPLRVSTFQFILHACQVSVGLKSTTRRPTIDLLSPNNKTVSYHQQNQQAHNEAKRKDQRSLVIALQQNVSMLQRDQV